MGMWMTLRMLIKANAINAKKEILYLQNSKITSQQQKHEKRKNLNHSEAKNLCYK
jgi:hypothetical protein